jgi:hypothetical protein
MRPEDATPEAVAAREERDGRILQLFLAGSTYRQIAAVVGLKSTQNIHEIVRRELSDAARRRSVLLEEARSIYQERSEALLKSHWGPALRGDHKSAEICRKLLDQQSRLLAPLAVPEGELPEEEVDELTKLRARRTGA